MREKYKHIIWDWNGTLFDDAWLCVNIMNTSLMRRNLPPLTLDRYRSIFIFPVRAYYQTLGFDFSTDSFEALSIEFMEQYEARWKECSLRPYVREVLTTIQRAGIEQSILSAYPHQSLVQIVRYFELEHFFERLIGLGDIYAASKLELGRNLMQKLGYATAEVLLIGDTLHDVEVAEEIGADYLLIAGGHISKERLLKRGFKVMDSLQELMANDRIFA